MKRKFASNVNDGNNKYIKKRVDEEYFKGYVCYVKVGRVKKKKIVKNGILSVCVLDNNYEWLELYPDDKNYALTIILDNKHNLVEWYFDVAKSIGIDNGIPYEDDLYLDVVFMTNELYSVLDEDELINALKRGDITGYDYELAYKTVYEIIREYEDINKLIALTDKVYALFISDKINYDKY